MTSTALTWWIIWGAMSASLFLLALVLYAVPPSGATPQVTPGFDRGMSIAAAALVLVAVALRRLLQSDSRVRTAAEASARLPSGQREPSFLGRMQGGFIASLAVHEAVALLGFVVAFVYREPARYWPFLLAALVLNLMVLPRPQALLARARELCPQLVGLALLLAFAACSFRGGDFTPMPKEPETPCLQEAKEICKEKLKSADIGNCVAREKYRCELQEQHEAPATPGSS